MSEASENRAAEAAWHEQARKAADFDAYGLAAVSDELLPAKDSTR